MSSEKKKVQKTVYFDEDVWDALEKQMRMSRNGNITAIVNDGLRYAMFPEHRNDRDADLVKLYHQLSYSLAEHRKKTARDLAFVQEINLRTLHAFFEQDDQDGSADERLDQLIQELGCGVDGLKPLSEK